MRIIEGRLGATPSKPLRILSILRVASDRQRAPALQALADLGHEVVYVEEILTPDAYRKMAAELKFDVAVLWGNSFQNLLMTADAPFFLDDIGLPYVSLWTDNPVKHLFLLKDVKTANHKGLFVADSRVVEQLTGLGFENVFYLPPWHIDPEIYRPHDPHPDYACDVGFAGAVNPYEAERAKWRVFWDYRMNAAADGVLSEMRDGGDHVDVFDALAGAWDVWEMPFSLISHAMYFEQKAVRREHLALAMAGRQLDVVGFGGESSSLANIKLHPGLEWSELSRFLCSAKVNLNLTPWPRSCHHRLFQAAASGAFMISDYRQDSAELFAPDTEAVTFKSLDELPGLIDRYLAHPAEAAAIAKAARTRFLAHHTAAHRMAELAAWLDEIL